MPVLRNNMQEDNKYKELFRGQIFIIDNENFRIEDVTIQPDAEDIEKKYFTLCFTAVDNPQKKLSMMFPQQALFLMLRNFMTFKDAAEGFSDDFESLAAEVGKISKKYKDKLARGLDAFFEELKKS